VRIGVDQNLYLLGLKEKSVPFAPVMGASHVTACAGSSYCALSLWDVKAETAYLPLEKIEAHQIQVGFSGCLKGCGRHHHCDIGLVGLRTNLFGETQKAARLFLGGQYSSGGMPARLIFPSVPLKHLSRLLEGIIAAYEASGEKDFEQFSDRWLNPHSTFFVMLWFLAQLYLKQPPGLTQESEADLYGKLRACEDFPVFEDDENYLKSIKTMMHALWDDEVNEK
jgi:ferredoxin-nitrite reductase